jgi:cytochrome P450
MSLEYEPLAPRFRDDPYPVYRRLRDEAPVYFAPEAKMFCVSRHADVGFVLRRPDLFSSAAMTSVLSGGSVGEMGPRFLLGLLQFLLKTRVNPFALRKRKALISVDGERHEALRSIVNRGFTPGRIAAWEPRVRAIVAAQLRKLASGEPFDLIDDLAIPLPVTIIAEILGVGAERRADFKRWSNALVSVMSGAARRGAPEESTLQDVAELFLFLRETVRERRRHPGDDLVSVLVDPARDAVLDEVDMVQFVVLLLVAGNETTTNLIGNAALALLEHPEALERVARDPERVPALVEEALRFDPPIQMVFRTVSQATELAGTRLPRGAVLAVLLGSANRDERAFAEPDRFDLARDTRGHFAFGFGPHFCLGAALARLEARATLEALAPELARCKRVGERNARIDSFLVRGRAHLDIAVERESFANAD